MENIKPDLLQVLILTKNEEPNIRRVLDKLTWVDRVVVLDSYSDDRTIEIVQSFDNIELKYRKFDSFAEQCNHGIDLMDSKWILSLDADYVLTDEFIAETREFISLDNKFVAYDSKFEFLIFGEKLLRNNTTPRPVLFKKNFGKYYNDGHAHRLKVDGEVGNYKSKILHDDRKSLSRWLSNQDRYSIKECNKLSSSSYFDISFNSRIRKNKILAPFFVFFYSLFVKGLILNGWAGWHYTLQRTMVEMLLALRLIEEKLKDKT